MIVPRCCARCHVVVSEAQPCPCRVCGACTTDGGLPGAGCACIRIGDARQVSGATLDLTAQRLQGGAGG